MKKSKNIMKPIQFLKISPLMLYELYNLNHLAPNLPLLGVANPDAEPRRVKATARAKMHVLAVVPLAVVPLVAIKKNIIK